MKGALLIQCHAPNGILHGCSSTGDSQLERIGYAPPIWVGHVVLETDRLEETEQFMRKLGMRPIVKTADVAVLELRGGTHLALVAKPEVVAGAAPFDLMVEHLQATHEHFTELGLAPTPIESMSPNHQGFLVREPAGHIITFFSNHVSGQPV
jgi:catechol 2,3-dioxygenase-like lactoylglutathione lyase family enzyme